MGKFNEEIKKIIYNNENFQKKNDSDKNKIIKEITDFTTDKMAESIKKDSTKISRKIKKINKKFNRFNIKIMNKTWKKVFDILDNILEITEESMESYSLEFNEKASKEKNYIYHVNRTIHARVVLCFKECLLLLKNGYSEAAMQIWRTMHELTIIAIFINKHSDDTSLAKKYIDHIVVDNYKEAITYTNEKGINKLYTSEAIKELENEYNLIIKKYGKEFKKDYGWAVNILKEKAPTFFDIESDINNIKLHPYYKSSCDMIHGNYKANVKKIGLIKNNVLLYGPTDYGLSIPCQNIAITLNQINTVFFNTYFSVDYIITIKTINLFLNELLPLADSIQQKLKDNYL